MENFLTQNKITMVLAPTTGVVGTVSTGTTILDMSGYEAVTFLTANSTVTSTGAYMAIYMGCSSGAVAAPVTLSAVYFGSCAANRASYAATEAYRPTQRFVTAYLIGASSCCNAGIYGIQHKPKNANVTQSTSGDVTFTASASSGSAT